MDDWHAGWSRPFGGGSRTATTCHDWLGSALRRVVYATPAQSGWATRPKTAWRSPHAGLAGAGLPRRNPLPCSFVLDRSDGARTLLVSDCHRTAPKELNPPPSSQQTSSRRPTVTPTTTTYARRLADCHRHPSIFPQPSFLASWLSLLPRLLPSALLRPPPAPRASMLCFLLCSFSEGCIPLFRAGSQGRGTCIGHAGSYLPGLPQCAVGLVVLHLSMVSWPIA